MRNRVRICQSVSALRLVDAQVLVCLRNSCHHVTDIGFARIALKFVVHNGRDLVDII
jgi:hypothetical protein